MKLPDLDLQQLHLSLDLVASWQLEKIQTREVWKDWDGHEHELCEKHDADGTWHTGWNYVDFYNKFPAYNANAHTADIIDRFQYVVEATLDGRIHLQTRALKEEDELDPPPSLQEVLEVKHSNYFHAVCGQSGIFCVS